METGEYTTKRNVRTSTGVGVKGRIAQVLAQARATLKEPSRPVTPASLDARTSLDIAIPYHPKERTKLSSIQRMLSENLTIPPPSSYAHVGHLSPAFEYDSIASRQPSSSLPTVQGLHLLMCDLKDMTACIESISIDINGFNVRQLLENLSQPVEKLAKYIKTADTFSEAVKMSVDTTCLDLSKALFRFMSDDVNFSIHLMHLSCKLVLRMVLAQLSNPRLLPSSFSRVLLRTMQSMYLRHQNEDKLNGDSVDDSSTGSNSTTEGILHGGMDLLLDLLRILWQRMAGDISMVMHSSHPTERSHPSDVDDGTYEDDDADLDPYTGARKVAASLTTTSSSTFTSRSFACRATTGAAGAATGISESEQSYVILLEAASYASGVLRSLSNQEVDRRRLMHLSIVERIAEGLRGVGSAVNHLKQLCESLVKSLCENGILSEAEAVTKLGRQRSVITAKLSQVLSQLVAVLRNCSLDQSGRTQMLSCEVVGVLCRLLRPFGEYPELVLNCARVTAKLSLLEPFRAQINRKPVHIKCLVDVIVSEASRCQQVMDGVVDTSASVTSITKVMTSSSSMPSSSSSSYSSSSARAEVRTSSSAKDSSATHGTHERVDEEEEDEDEVGASWPTWHTWPLLSRISFTLGNLTTSNDANRATIGIECKCLKPLVVLLQACSCSLTALCAQSGDEDDDDDEDDEGDEGDDVEDEEEGENVSRISGRDNNREDGRTRPGVGGGGNRAQTERGDEGGEASAGEVELWDATIKLLRLLANICINETIGAALGRRSEAIQMLIELLACAGQSKKKEHEELLLNVVAACTNVTFYACQKNAAPPTPARDGREEARAAKERERLERTLVSLSLHLSHCLFHENDEVVLETARALGNLTRSNGVLKALRSSRADEALVLLVGHADRDVAAAVTGALVNLTADPMSRAALIRSANPAASLVGLLRRSSLKDLHVSGLVCQVFHNLLLEGDGRQLLLDGPWSEALGDTLSELIECAEEFEKASREKENVSKTMVDGAGDMRTSSSSSSLSSTVGRRFSKTGGIGDSVVREDELGVDGDEVAVPRLRETRSAVGLFGQENMRGPDNGSVSAVAAISRSHGGKESTAAALTVKTSGSSSSGGQNAVGSDSKYTPFVQVGKLVLDILDKHFSEVEEGGGENDDDRDGYDEDFA